jgi:hypothetical protein
MKEVAGFALSTTGRYLARSLPSCTWGVAVSGAMQGLWLGARSALSVVQVKWFVSAVAAALRGPILPSCVRAKDAELLLRAPGSHRSHMLALWYPSLLPHVVASPQVVSRTRFGLTCGDGVSSTGGGPWWQLEAALSALGA